MGNYYVVPLDSLKGALTYFEAVRRVLLNESAGLGPHAIIEGVEEPAVTVHWRK